MEKGFVKIPFIDRVPSCKILPGNLFTKLIWRFIKFEVKNYMVDNPIKTLINQETNLCDLIPRKKFKVDKNKKLKEE